MLRLGLDLGTNSIGWALYRLDAGGEPEALIGGGVLIHSDGRQSSGSGRGRGASNAAGRREKRGMRRNRDRTLRRRRRVARLLRGHGLLPTEPAERDRVRQLDPMRLRAEALDRPLTPHELGRALLSFADRRGFKSNRQTDGGEDGAIRKDTGELHRRMAQSGSRTLGEYLWRRRRRGETIRARPTENKEHPYGGLYPDRAMVEHELGEIRSAQGPHHPRVGEDDWQEIIATLLYQRDLQPAGRGKCTLMPAEERTYRAHPLFQEFRIRQDVANVRVTGPDGERPLGDGERKRLVCRLMDVGTMTFRSIISHLALPEDSHINFARGRREKMIGDETAAVLRKKDHFGTGWATLSSEQQREVVERLLDHEIGDKEVSIWLQDEAGLSAEVAYAVTQAKRKLPRGTSHLSIAALERLLPCMREGMDYSTARQKAFPEQVFGGDGSFDRLPPYDKVLERHLATKNRIANPTVHIALGQMRRLFNTIADRYGKPGEVVVELARDLKRGFEEREKVQKAQDRNKRLTEELREIAAKAGYPAASHDDIEKLWLWKQQQVGPCSICPYTGDTLSVTDVLSPNLTQIDHILPRTRSFDDSRNNRVVVATRANQEKRNRTPFEAWGGTEEYEQLLARVQEMKKIPKGKRWRFTEEAAVQLESGDFLARHLNETRYLSRLIREYLTFAVPNVRVTSGQLTALLREQWGLKKDRNDHRHHLIDAVVIGATSQSMVQRMARENDRSPNSLDTRIRISPPWGKDSFRKEVERRVEHCIVRHRPDHFQPSGGTTTGKLHRETAYGVVKGPDEKGMMTLVVTKPLQDMKPGELGQIRDGALGDRLQALWRHIDAGGGKPKEKWNQFCSEAWTRHHVRRVRLCERHGKDNLAFIPDKSGSIHKAYETHGNAFMDIWLLPNGKTVGETVNRFNAHNRANYFDMKQRNYRSKIKSEYPAAKKLMRLHIDDMIAVGEGDELRIMRVLKLSGSRIEAVDHVAGGKVERVAPYRKSAGQVIQAGLRKVSVDVLGRVQDGGPLGADGRGKSGTG